MERDGNIRESGGATSSDLVAPLPYCADLWSPTTIDMPKPLMASHVLSKHHVHDWTIVLTILHYVTDVFHSCYRSPDLFSLLR
jgi:hypothetical protein